MTIILIIVALILLALGFVVGMFTACIIEQKDRKRWREQHQNAIDDITREDSQ